jgi:2-dehydro-3-deoxyphosphooctonate aldolase (KDO 8-P synthase)
MPHKHLAFLFEGKRPFLIAGPSVLEDLGLALEIGRECGRIARTLGVPYIFKSSFDKANRSSLQAFRGPGLQRGLAMLAKVKEKLKVPILTDVHEADQVKSAVTVADVVQVPAFLCRQTDLLVACGESGAVVNIKKGQFVAPQNMGEVVNKVSRTGNRRILLTERGFAFGYDHLVVDFTSLQVLKKLKYPVVFDATHSVLKTACPPAGAPDSHEQIALLARAAAAVGVDGYFFEVHPRPEKAFSDGASLVGLKKFLPLLKNVLEFDRLARRLRG